MQYIKSLSNLDLVSKTKTLAAEERRITTEILWLLKEVEFRRIHASLGYGSLFDFIVHGLGYSEAAAARRLNAMRILQDVPEVASALEAGTLNLSTVSTVQGFLRREKKERGVTYSQDEKRSLLKKVEGQSARECEKILATLSPVAMLPKEQERVITSDRTELKVVLPQEVMEKLQRIRSLRSHATPDATYADLIGYMAELTLEKIDPARIEKRAQVRKAKAQAAQAEPISKVDGDLRTDRPCSEIVSPPPSSSSEGAVMTQEVVMGGSEVAQGQLATSTTPTSELRRKRPHIPAAVRREVFIRDDMKCTYVDPISGRRCNSDFQVQNDHRIPVALGGASDVNSLRNLCSTHNRLEAIRILGAEAMQPFLRF